MQSRINRRCVSTCVCTSTHAYMHISICVHVHRPISIHSYLYIVEPFEMKFWVLMHLPVCLQHSIEPESIIISKREVAKKGFANSSEALNLSPSPSQGNLGMSTWS